jgi:hypothetical protein
MSSFPIHVARMQVICVSHTSRENTALRACLAPANISVIPNGKYASWSPHIRAVLATLALRMASC